MKRTGNTGPRSITCVVPDRNGAPSISRTARPRGKTSCDPKSESKPRKRISRLRLRLVAELDNQAKREHHREADQRRIEVVSVRRPVPPHTLETSACPAPG